MENDLFGSDIAFKIEFLTSASGDIELISGLDNLKESIMRRIVTTPGSIIHRPNYGVGIKLFLNGLSSLYNQRKLANAIDEQLSQDPRVESVEGVRVDFDQNRPDFIKIEVRIKPVGFQEQKISIIPFGGY